ncbi:MAG: DMT family transporter [Saprospiraceae bacterium]|nr:DMT family transporter [Saprospiraceae bacterium]
MSKYVWLMVLPAAFWALNFYLAGFLLQYSSVSEAGFWRYAFGVLVLVVLAARQMPKWSAMRVEFLRLFLIGFVGLFLFNYFFFQGLETTSAMNATIITSLNPMMTLVLSRILLGIAIKRTHWIGIGLGLLGALYFLSRGSFDLIADFRITVGETWMLLATFVFALHHVWVKQYNGPLNIHQFTLVTNLICFLGFVLILPYYGLGTLSDYPWTYWLAAGVMGGLGTALAYYIWNKGIEQLGAPQAGIYINLIPILTALMAVPFGETVEQHHVVGGVLVICGVIVMQGRLAHWLGDK